MAATFGFGALTGGATAQAFAKPPQPCLDYIDLSQELMTQVGDVLQATTNAANAGFTTRALERATDQMDEVTPKVQALVPKLSTAEEQCRGGK